MARPVRFEHYRWLGDKRNQRVHDLDHSIDECGIDDIVASGTGTVFGPDILPEAKNRCYHACRHCVPAGVPAE
jgi:hypothetical protein